MGQIKNIKLHIVTDIKIDQNECNNRIDDVFGICPRCACVVETLQHNQISSRQKIWKEILLVQNKLVRHHKRPHWSRNPMLHPWRMQSSGSEHTSDHNDTERNKENCEKRESNSSRKHCWILDGQGDHSKSWTSSR